jgi:hypothetical protein
VGFVAGDTQTPSSQIRSPLQSVSFVHCACDVELTTNATTAPIPETNRRNIRGDATFASSLQQAPARRPQIDAKLCPGSSIRDTES